MNPRTERLIRADIKARWAPGILLFWLFAGCFFGIALLGGLGTLVHFLRVNGY